MSNMGRKIPFLSVILIILIIQLIAVLPSPARAETGSILYSCSQPFAIDTNLSGMILDSSGEHIYAALDQISTYPAAYTSLVELRDYMYVVSNASYEYSNPNSQIVTPATYVVIGINGSEVGLSPSESVALITNGHSYAIVAINQSVVIGMDNRYAYYDGEHVYVLGRSNAADGEVYITLWSNELSSGSRGTVVSNWSDPYLRDGYEVASFAYNSSNKHLYIAYATYMLEGGYDVVIVDYDINSGSWNEVYRIMGAESFPRSFIIYDGVLYGLIYKSRYQGGYAMLLIYNTSTVATVQLFSEIPITYTYDNIVKPINGKIVAMSDLQGEGESDWITGISEYDPSTGAVNELGIVNLTEILGANSEEGASYHKDIAYGSDGYYRLGLMVAGPGGESGSYIASYIIRCTPEPSSPPPPPPPSQQTVYQLSRMYSWGGDKAYTFLDFHFINKTAGYLTATSRLVDPQTKVVDNATAGIAVILVLYDDNTENVSAILLIDENNLTNATGSLYTGNAPNTILFYGYKTVNGHYNATIVAWNATSNETTLYTYSDYKSLAEAVPYIEYNSTGNITLSWLLFIAWNGTILNASVDYNGNLGLQPVTPAVAGLSEWHFNDTSGLVRACPIPGVNATILVTLEPDAEGNSTIMRIYNLTRNQDLVLRDITPANLPTFPLLSTEDDAGISDVFCAGSKILININYNINGTSYIILVNKTDDSIYEIFQNATVTLYKYSGYSYTPMLGASYLPGEASLRMGIVYSVDMTTGRVNEVATLSTNANEEIGMAVTLGTMILSYGVSYNSPSNITISGVSLSVAPIPENSLLIVVPIIAMTIYLLIIKYRSPRRWSL